MVKDIGPNQELTEPFEHESLTYTSKVVAPDIFDKINGLLLVVILVPLPILNPRGPYSNCQLLEPPVTHDSVALLAVVAVTVKLVGVAH